MTPEVQRGYWHRGGPLIRAALMLPPIVGLVFGTVFTYAAMKSTETGLDPTNRVWFFLMVPAAQFGSLVIATMYLASLYVGEAVLPAWMRSSPVLLDALNRQRRDRDPVEGLGLPRRVITAMGLALGGTLAAVLAVPVQVMLSTWLVFRPDLYSDVERVVVGVETAAAIAWVAYLVRRLWHPRPDH